MCLCEAERDRRVSIMYIKYSPVHRTERCRCEKRRMNRSLHRLISPDIYTHFLIIFSNSCVFLRPLATTRGELRKTERVKIREHEEHFLDCNVYEMKCKKLCNTNTFKQKTLRRFSLACSHTRIQKALRIFHCNKKKLSC